MTYSLNEIEVTSKRAACGAGLDWGIAEDAGRAVRWLAERGLPGPELLSALLVAHKGLTYQDLAPQLDAGTWQAPAGRLCPLIAGSALCDRAGALAADERFLLGPVSFPLLLAPYLAVVASLTDTSFKLSWAGVEIKVEGGAVSTSGDTQALSVAKADDVSCERAAGPVNGDGKRMTGADVDSAAWSTLQGFAGRKYAPATEASRSAGAGAGTTDND